MLRQVLCIAVLLTLGVSCRDSPSSVAAPADEGPAEPSNPNPLSFELTQPVIRITQMGTDPFVQPLMVRVVGPMATDVLTRSLASIATDPIEPTLLNAIWALSDVQRRIQVARSIPNTPAFQTEGEGDPEFLIIEDALSLVVDDALQTLLSLSDSIGP